MRHFSVLVIITALLFFSAARADEVRAGTQQIRLAHSITKTNISIPVEMDEAAKAVIVEKLTSLEEQRFVYLDLSLEVSPRSGDMAPYRLTQNGKAHGLRQKGCDTGALSMVPGLVYELGPMAGYNHLLMSIYTGDRSVFPYHDVSCEYVSSGHHQQFRIRGFFHIVTNSIPTAVGLQLRPFNPPFEIAAKVLAR